MQARSPLTFHEINFRSQQHILSEQLLNHRKSKEEIVQEQVLRVKLRILDAPKRQPVRGSGVAGIFAARAFERVTEFGDVVIALPDAEHGADHDANHVVKKTAARNIVNDTVPVAAPAGEKIVRTVVSALLPAALKAAKSCVPRKSSAAALSFSMLSGV